MNEDIKLSTRVGEALASLRPFSVIASLLKAGVAISYNRVVAAGFSLRLFAQVKTCDYLYGWVVTPVTRG